MTNWRVNYFRLFEATDGTLKWRDEENTAYRTNCDVNHSIGLHRRYPGIAAKRPKIRVKYRHNTVCCGPFYPVVVVNV